jgi:hypothetical protein
MLCILIFIYIITQYFLSNDLSSVYGAIGVECVRVGCVKNICVTHSEMMHLTWTCEMCDFRIVQRILDSLKITTVACYLMYVLYIFPFMISAA